MDDRCEIRGCRAEADLIYLGHGVCSHHWNRWTADDTPPDALRMVLGIEVNAPSTMEVDMSETKKTESKKSKKELKAKKEKAPKENLVVFAFRLAPEERDAIHAAAGPGGASRFVRAVAIAAAKEDDAAYKAALKEAREARQ